MMHKGLVASSHGGVRANANGAMGGVAFLASSHMGPPCCLSSPCAVSRQLSFTAAFGWTVSNLSRGVRPTGNGSRRRRRRKGVEAQIEMFSSDDFSVERLLGTQGYMNVKRWGDSLIVKILHSPIFVLFTFF